MKKDNRVFFENRKEAMLRNFRPCGHCMVKDYKKWKQRNMYDQRETPVLPGLTA